MRALEGFSFSGSLTLEVRGMASLSSARAAAQVRAGRYFGETPYRVVSEVGTESELARTMGDAGRFDVTFELEEIEV